MNGDLCIFDDDDDVRQQLSEMFQELLLANVTQHYGNVENDLLNVSLSLSLSLSLPLSFSITFPLLTQKDHSMEISVTRLGDFLKFLATNFLPKVA